MLKNIKKFSLKMGKELEQMKKEDYDSGKLKLVGTESRFLLAEGRIGNTTPELRDLEVRTMPGLERVVKGNSPRNYATKWDFVCDKNGIVKFVGEHYKINYYAPIARLK